MVRRCLRRTVQWEMLSHFVLLISVVLLSRAKPALPFSVRSSFATFSTRASWCNSRDDGSTLQAFDNLLVPYFLGGDVRSRNTIIMHSYKDDDVDYKVDSSMSEKRENDLLMEAKEGAPSEFTVMKELLGINVFTYVLAAACIFFLGMNAILGPGWLGQTIGLKGTGTFTEVSDSLPGNIDLSGKENLL